jgi:hypothetical protein
VLSVIFAETPYKYDPSQPEANASDLFTWTHPTLGVPRQIRNRPDTPLPELLTRAPRGPAILFCGTQVLPLLSISFGISRQRGLPWLSIYFERQQNRLLLLSRIRRIPRRIRTFPCVNLTRTIPIRSDLHLAATALSDYSEPLIVRPATKFNTQIK